MAKKTKTTRNPARAPAHPGVLLREAVLPDLCVTKSAFAEAIKMSRNQLYLILTERQPITPETAVKLEAALGGSETTRRLNMQAAHDLWHAQRSTDLSGVKHPGDRISPACA